MHNLYTIWILGPKEITPTFVSFLHILILEAVLQIPRITKNSYIWKPELQMNDKYFKIAQTKASIVLKLRNT